MSNLINVNSWSDALSAAEMIAKTNLCPPNYRNKKEDIIVAWAMGTELGMKPMQSLQHIAVINGKPCLYGDGLLALVKNDPRCLGVQETTEGEGDDYTAVCSVKRKYDDKNIETTVCKFSIKDAKRAKLFNRPVWQSYPQRMLQMRARGFALRNAFPDALSGFISQEEAEDYPTQAKTVNNLNDLKPKEIKQDDVKKAVGNEAIATKSKEAETSQVEKPNDKRAAVAVQETNTSHNAQDPVDESKWPIINHDGNALPNSPKNAIMFVGQFCEMMRKYANSEKNKDGQEVSPRDRMTLLKEFRNMNAEQLDRLEPAQLKPVAETYKKLLAFLGAKQNG